MPCLNEDCLDKLEGNHLLPSGGELCTICYTGEPETEACVQLRCGHVFHANCVYKLLKFRWTTLKISFAFMSCPQCKQEIEEERCKEIGTELRALRAVRREVETAALDVAKKQGIADSDRLTQKGGPYEGKLLELAMHSCAFYQCSDCSKPYFGGMIDCQAQLGMEEKIDKEALRCQDCQIKAYGAGQSTCAKHGTAHIEWKCNLCCSVAVWHCFGTNYFCEACHET